MVIFRCTHKKIKLPTLHHSLTDVLRAEALCQNLYTDYIAADDYYTEYQIYNSRFLRKHKQTNA